MTLKMITLIMIASSIAMLLMMMCTIISKKSKKDKEKLSPFECGFNPLSSARTPFSIQFFLITLLFLVFDVEIAIIIPILMSMKWTLNMAWMMTSMTFLMILIMGLYHEWKNGVLEWT